MTKGSRFIERLAKLKVEIVENMPDLLEHMKTRGRVGAGKITDDGTKTRAIVEDAIEDFVSDLPLTYTEKAKLVLLDVMDIMDIKRFRYSIGDVYSYPPLYSKSGVYSGNWCYVDIKSAYATIYQFFLNVKYLRNKYLSDAVITPFVELKDKLSKRTRNSVFGVMRSTLIRRYERDGNGKLAFRWVEAVHSLINYDLVNLTYDILQAVAFKAVKDYGAVYFNTDGAIIPARCVDAYINFLHELGFNAGVKLEGEGVIVKACNAYRVGNFESLSFQYVKFFRDFSNLITESEADWILRMYAKKVSKVL